MTPELQDSLANAINLIAGLVVSTGPYALALFAVMFITVVVFIISTFIDMRRMSGDWRRRKGQRK